MAKNTKKFDEMLRLYQDENMSLQQVGDHFGIKRQAVHDRFKRAGINLRSNTAKIRTALDREVLTKLYEEDQLTIGQISKKLNVCFAKVSAEFKRHGIEKRAVSVGQRKHPELWLMKAGDTLIVPRPLSLKPYSSLYGMAKNARIKISIKTLESGNMRVTCLSVFR